MANGKFFSGLGQGLSNMALLLQQERELKQRNDLMVKEYKLALQRHLSSVEEAQKDRDFTEGMAETAHKRTKEILDLNKDLDLVLQRRGQAHDVTMHGLDKDLRLLLQAGSQEHDVDMQKSAQDFARQENVKNRGASMAEQRVRTTRKTTGPQPDDITRAKKMTQDDFDRLQQNILDGYSADRYKNFLRKDDRTGKMVDSAPSRQTIKQSLLKEKPPGVDRSGEGVPFHNEQLHPSRHTQFTQPYQYYDTEQASDSADAANLQKLGFAPQEVSERYIPPNNVSQDDLDFVKEINFKLAEGYTIHWKAMKNEFPDLNWPFIEGNVGKR